MARIWMKGVGIALISILVLSGDHPAFGTRDSRRDPLQYQPSFVGPRYLPKGIKPDVPAQFVETVFEKYKAKHAKVRQSLTGVGRSLNSLKKQGAIIPGIKVHVALLTELRRLNDEHAPLIGQRAIAAPEFLRLMSDSMMVLEYLELLGSYARALNEIAKDPVIEGVRLTEGEMLTEAARRFPEEYLNQNQEGWSFSDRDVTLFSSQGAKLIPLAESLFSESSADPISYRVQFFMGYSESIIKKNKVQIDELRSKKPSS